MKHVVAFSIAFRPYIGGAEVAVEEISKRLSNYSWSIVTLRFSKKDKKVEEWDGGRIKIYRIGPTWFPLFLRKVCYVGMAPLFALFKLPKAQIAWSMMANYAGFAGFFYSIIKPKVRYVLTLQEGDSIHHVRNRAKKVFPIFRAMFGRADTVQTISNYLAQFAKSIYPSLEPVVIPNGADIDIFKKNQGFELESEKIRVQNSIPNDAFVLVTTSRLVTKNGVDRVIRALPNMPEDVHFLIVGEGELKRNLEDLANSLNVANRVHFVGLVMPEAVPKYLHASNAFIRLSRTEGMGNSFVEAMAAGIPVIATGVGGIPDVISHRRNGLIVIGDVDSVVEAVNMLRTEVGLRSKLITQALVDAEDRFQWEKIAGMMDRDVFSIDL